jgi:uncharacterized membrane protein
MAQSESARLEAFSDGVFAIAITLLILEIKVPTSEEMHTLGGLWPALAHRWPSVLGYVISFTTIGVMWTNHHSLFEVIRKVDRTVMLANIFLLMAISFLPFPTAVLAENLPDPETRTAATAFYGVAVFVIALGYNAVRWSASREQLAGRVRDPDEQLITTRRRIRQFYWVGSVGYVVAIAMAYVNVWASLAVHTGLALMFAVSDRKS